MRMIEHDAHWRSAVERFEQGAFWDAHEALEPRWLVAQGLERSFAAGVILLAAALHKARGMASPRGARRNYAKALRHLALVPDTYADTDVRALEAEVHAALRDPRLRPRWTWVRDGDATSPRPHGREERA